MNSNIVPIAALIGIVLLYQAALHLPTKAATLLAMIIFAVTHIAAVRVADQIKSLRPEMAAAQDPWAIPSRQTRQLADRSRQLALRQMNLRSMFPNAATRGVQLAERLGYA